MQRTAERHSTEHTHVNTMEAGWEAGAASRRVFFCLAVAPVLEAKRTNRSYLGGRIAGQNDDAARGYALTSSPLNRSPRPM
jgi:hypothetical protein